MSLERIKQLAGILNESSIDEKSSSEKQARFMAAASHDPEFAKKAGVDVDVAKEFNKADTGTEQLSRPAKNNEESCSMEEAFDLQNGYDDIHDALGDDYFPNGADSPVTKSTGPSGARQGDNPEQKTMKVDETHRELVYAYRKFLDETVNVTDYNPKSQGGTRKELLDILSKTGKSEDATKARRAGATQNELKAAIDQSKQKLKENQQYVSDVEVQDFHNDAMDRGTQLVYNGPVTFYANVIDKTGNKIGVIYTLDISATSEIIDVADEQPTSWNYKTEQPNYTDTSHTMAGEPKFTKIGYIPEQKITINDEDLSLKDAQEIISPSALKSMINPSLYIESFQYLFDQYI